MSSAILRPTSFAFLHKDRKAIRPSRALAGLTFFEGPRRENLHAIRGNKTTYFQGDLGLLKGAPNSEICLPLLIDRVFKGEVFFEKVPPFLENTLVSCMSIKDD